MLTGLPAAAGEAGKAAADILARAPTTADPVAQDALKLLAGLLSAAKGCELPFQLVHCCRHRGTRRFALLHMCATIPVCL